MTARAAYQRLVVDGMHAPIELPPPLPAPDTLDAKSIWSALHDIRFELAMPIAARVPIARTLLGYAPTALLDGIWLAPCVHVRHSHGELGLACIEAMYHLGGGGDAALDRATRYRGLLAAHGIAVTDPTTPSFVNDPRFSDGDFGPAVIAASISRGAFPEALGYHAAAAVLGAPAVVRRDPYGQPDERDEALALRCLELYERDAVCDWAALWRGACALVDARTKWLASLEPPRVPEPWPAMLALVESKLRRAQGYHHRVRLDESRTIDTWLDPAKPDVPGFLATLATSRHIVPGDPDASPLLAKSVAFGGPMFGVFTAGELDVVRAWIRALPDEPRPSTAAVKPAPAPLARSPRIHVDRDRLALPALYYRLLTDRGDDTRALARGHLERALPTVTPRQLAKRELWPYSFQRLDAWVHARLDAEASRSGDQLGIAAEVTRDETLWLLTQLAPSALIDGAWLGGVIAPQCFHTSPVVELFKIYRDELGSGVVRQHHGNVLRKALAQHDIELPPPDSAQFVALPQLLPQAFSLPVLWLSIAAHTADFMPELLGLNLAIEMAGLGRGYARATALLRHHGIDPYFFELHNTIDNAASGHTAWSTRAIALYLDALGDPRAIDAAWLRLWQGHDAYARASAPLVRAVALRFGPRLALRWLRRKLRRSPA